MARCPAHRRRRRDRLPARLPRATARPARGGGDPDRARRPPPAPAGPQGRREEQVPVRPRRAPLVRRRRPRGRPRGAPLETAKAALQPPRSLRRPEGLRASAADRRKEPLRRQGEWFFVPEARLASTRGTCCATSRWRARWNAARAARCSAAAIPSTCVVATCSPRRCSRTCPTACARLLADDARPGAVTRVARCVTPTTPRSRCAVGTAW